MHRITSVFLLVLLAGCVQEQTGDSAQTPLTSVPTTMVTDTTASMTTQTTLESTTTTLMPLIPTTMTTNPTTSTTNLPPWVVDLIATKESSQVENPPASLTKCIYQNRVVYYYPPVCCDQWSILFAENGSILCAPDGGLRGTGDGRCPDYFGKRTDCITVWADSRRFSHLTTTTLPANKCLLAPDQGPCEAMITRYYFNLKTGQCQSFIWGGCKGVVPFETYEECYEACENRCAGQGESFSETPRDGLPSKCCEGLIKWIQLSCGGVSIGNTCYSQGIECMTGPPFKGTCIRCGDGVCGQSEDVCSCPQDCINGEHSKYSGVSQFCDKGYSAYCTIGLVKKDLPLCKLCS
jgi:hypothetical protein